VSERIDVPLPDGRRLEAEISGPPDSDLVLLWHHGTPGAAAQPTHIRSEAHQRGVRLLTYTRAGGGRSTRNKGRSVADVAPDMEGLLDHLGVARCISAGGSGGGPHALATGALLPERVVAAISVAGARPYGEGFLEGMGQDNIDEFGLALQGEEALRPFLEAHQQVLATARAEDVMSQLKSLLPEPDLAVLTGELGEEIAADMREAVERLDGWLDDDLAFVKPWGFDPGQISVATYIWQGGADLMVPPAHATYLASLMPQATLHLEEGEGHLSVSVGYFGRALDEALAHA
jgi:pimeloyl-ACP methyl ester carboxylesterase